MQDVIYLFKDTSPCTHIFHKLYLHMKDNGFNCVELVDEIDTDPKSKILPLIGKKIVLVVSDHLTHKSPNSYSILELIALLKPIKTFYSLHDLGIHRIDDNINGFHMLLPHDCWRAMTNNFTLTGLDIVGYPKFTTNTIEIKYDIVFFPSSIYVYAERPPSSFATDFKSIIDKNIAIKFPNFPKSYQLIQKIPGLRVIDPKLESFDILLQCNTSISNANSSIAVEAAIAGCNAINIGVLYGPNSTYDRFKITTVSTTSHYAKHVNQPRQTPMSEMLFDIQKTISILKNI